MRLLHQGPWASCRWMARNSPFSFVTHFGHPGYIVRWVTHIGKGYKGFFCLQSLVKVESHTKESSKRCQTVLGFRHGPEGCSLPLRCTLVRHPDHIMLSIFHFKYFRPSSLLFKPGFLWLNPESLAAALATVNRPRAEPKTCTKSGA